MPRKSKALLNAEREEVARCDDAIEYLSALAPVLRKCGELTHAAEATRRASAYKAARRLRDAELMKHITTRAQEKGNI